MDELYTSFHYSSDSPPIPNIPIVEDGSSSNFMTTGATAAAAASQYEYEYDYDYDYDDDGDIIKAQIANHPLYPTLLSSYIECTKVGASPEMTSLLEEISKENQPTFHTTTDQIIGTDPELDHFMKSYCDALKKYKDELWKPLVEARKFLSYIGSELTHLCNQTLNPIQLTTSSIQTHHSSTAPSDWEYLHKRRSQSELMVEEEEEEGIGVGVGIGCGSRDKELREMVMRKYSGYLTTLRMDMLKKRKKGKLPKIAISALFQWWNSHYTWPYPTEEEKRMLSEKTGLDQKQINNWFINQRKRHWRPSQDMTFALIQGVATTSASAAAAGGGGGGDHVNISTN